MHSPCHAISPLSVKSHTKIKRKYSPPSVGVDCCLDSYQEHCFIRTSTQQKLEAHTKQFHMNMLPGLPSKFLESTEIFQSRNSSSPFLLYSNLPSSKLSISSWKVGTENSAPALDCFLLATSYVGKKGQGSQTQLPADSHHGLEKDVQSIKDARHIPLPITHNIVVKQVRQNPVVKISSQNPQENLGTYMRQKIKSVRSSEGIEMQQGVRI